MLYATSSFDIKNKLAAISFVEKIICYKEETTHNKKSKTEETFDCDFATADSYGAAASQNKMIHIPTLHAMGYKGEGMLIAMMDVGFTDANTNPFFAKVYARNGVLKTMDVVDNEVNVYDNSSHGLSCWSTIAANKENELVGTAPNANFLLYRTENDASETIVEEYNWAFAAEDAENEGAQIFSTSLGYTTFDRDSMNHTLADLDGNTTVIAKAANRAAGLGVLVVNSAGNEGNDPVWQGHISSPADADSAMAVGAVDSNGVIADFSGRGFLNSLPIKPNVCAQGVKTAVVDAQGNVLRGNGTSFACPIIAGAAACLWQSMPNKTNFEIMQAIEKSSNYFFMPNVDYGNGIPNFYTAYQLLNNDLSEVALQQTNEQLLIYQNPMAEKLQFIFFTKKNRALKINVADIQGKTILSDNACVNANEFLYYSSEKLSQLARGTYILQIIENNKLLNARKFLKN